MHSLICNHPGSFKHLTIINTSKTKSVRLGEPTVNSTYVCKSVNCDSYFECILVGYCKKLQQQQNKENTNLLYVKCDSVSITITCELLILANKHACKVKSASAT